MLRKSISHDGIAEEPSARRLQASELRLSDRLSGRVILVFILMSAYAVHAFAQDTKLGDVPDGNRSIPVHLIDLYDEEGSLIRPGDEPVLPFSTKQTCLKCHNYRKISSGWHFNAADPDATPGRSGQPWILVDQGTATQLPLSYRPWPGTYRPEQVGLSPMRFIRTFGRHMPGGGIGEDEKLESADFFMRWLVSGKLEINCLSCHDAEPAHDQAEYATQIIRENFRWAASASSGFALVRGSAQKMPDNYNIYGTILDDPKAVPPTISYDKTRFNAQGKVFFDIVRKIPNERCYFCHSTKSLRQESSERWTEDEDVHLTAGMLCVDCHRNGLDHAMVRGYEGEAEECANPAAAVLTCRGCHLDNKSSVAPQAGRFSAPQPEHAGIPPVHFDKLTCTACHSGNWPKRKGQRVKTSRAHGLGTHGVNKSGEALPHIISPVFVEQSNGKIAPHKLFWPAFWARLNRGEVTPIAPEMVRNIAVKIIARDTLGTGDWPDLTRKQIADFLLKLAEQDSGKVQPAYIAGGKLYRLTEYGRLSEEEHPAAEPYSWAIAHDVRPAAQSLGVRGCEDCHATGAPFYFGEVAVDSPLTSERGSTKKMVEFERISPFYARVFAFSFVFRPWLKMIAFASSAVLAAILLLYAFKGLAAVLKAADK